MKERSAPSPPIATHLREQLAEYSRGQRSRELCGVVLLDTSCHNQRGQGQGHYADQREQQADCFLSSNRQTAAVDTLREPAVAVTFIPHSLTPN